MYAEGKSPPMEHTRKRPLPGPRDPQAERKAGSTAAENSVAADSRVWPGLSPAESAQSGGIMLDDSGDEADSANNLPAAASANASTIGDGASKDNGASVAPLPQWDDGIATASSSASDAAAQGEKPYACSICPTRFSIKSDVLRHERTHTGEKPYACSVCPRRFGQKSAVALHELAQHERVAATEAVPFRCSFCPKRFKAKCRVARHERTHTGVKPYACSMCPRRFTQRGDVAPHERTHTGEKPYACSMCPKLFSIKSNVAPHEWTHTGERPYACSMCPSRFTARSNVGAHERTHTGEKRYACSMCPKLFAVRRAVTQHERTHTGEKPYACSICPKRFAQKNAVAPHERAQHKSERAVRLPDVPDGSGSAPGPGPVAEVPHEASAAGAAAVSLTSGVTTAPEIAEWVSAGASIDQKFLDRAPGLEVASETARQKRDVEDAVLCRSAQALVSLHPAEGPDRFGV